MAVFAIIASKNPELLERAIVAQYGANHFRFADNVWFVSDIGETKRVAEKLDLFSGQLGALGIVTEVSAYTGYASAPTWDWLKQYPEARSNG